jgi:hypothetical protein
LSFFFKQEGLPQLQDDAYGSDEEEERNDEGDDEENEGEEENNVAEAQENEDAKEDGEQPALWLRGPAGLPPLPATYHEKWVIELTGDK